MYFGIDLGTTNSLIGHGTEMYTGLVSSNVDISTGKQVTRDTVSTDIIQSYKTDMSKSESGQLPIKCSAIILKELAELAERRCGEKVRDVILSVPAYFSTSQREAVIEAAESVNLNVKRLLNEPTAAAIFVCHDLQDLVVVYDLGGGTFDITVIDRRMGNYSVIATDGCVLGGDDFDLALVDDAIKKCRIPVRYRTKLGLKKLKSQLRLVKEQVQRNKDTAYADLSEFGAACEYALTVDEYKKIMRDTFEKTIMMTGDVLRKYVPSCETPKMVFVGGSSNCPYLRELVQQELGLEEIHCDTNPDLIVAKGVAIYADMLERGVASDIVEDVTKRFCIEDERGTTITIIDNNSVLPCGGTITVSNSKRGDTLSLDLYQGDKLLAADNEFIGKLVYNYLDEQEPNEGLVEVQLDVSVNGIVRLSAMELLYGESTKQEIELSAR